MTAAVIIPQGGLALAGSGSYVVGNGGGAVDADVVVEWDLDNDGDFDESIEDITTGRAMAVETMTGRDYPSSLTGVAGSGQMRVTCLNDDGALSWFNEASPLNTDPYSLDVGRRLRLRTSDASPTEPTLLARDRFDRADGDLGVTETGQTWTNHLNSFQVVDGVARAITDSTTPTVATIDVGTATQFVQCTIRQCKPNEARLQGFVLRFTDTDNYLIVVYWPGNGIRVYDRIAGTSTLLVTLPFVAWEGMTFGASAIGSTVTVYVGGARVLTQAVTTSTGNSVGLYASFNENTGRGPEYDDFHVWDSLPAETEGVLWTGAVADVTPHTTATGLATATVAALGPLSIAAETEVAAPRLPVQGAPTGTLVGDVMSRAGLGWPPVPLDEGDAETGPMSIDDGTALDLARQIEETERGFIHETNEGYVGFHAASRRVDAPSQAWFSDTAGVGQYRYTEIAPLDHRGQIVNRVTAGVTPYAPFEPTVTLTAGTSTGITYTYPGGLQEGELIVLFIASTIQDDDEEWLVPLWWVPHRDIKSTMGLRVYTHNCSGTETGSVTFYANTAAAAGLWQMAAVRIPPPWYGSYNAGIAMGDPIPGERPAPLVHGWGRFPTMFIACVAGMGGTGSGMEFSSDFGPPDGYGAFTGSFTSSGTLATEAGIVVSNKVDVAESEHPTEFFGLDNVDLEESVIFAVRGYNGPHTKQTLENPNNTGGTGVTVTVEDVDSQERHRLIRPHETASNLFPGPNQAGQYGLAVLAEFADDRPIVSMTFEATLDAAHRAQAIRRRVGDKITLTASGASGLGFERDMFIEHIHHRITDAGKRWLCTWQLSPA